MRLDFADGNETLLYGLSDLARVIGVSPCDMSKRVSRGLLPAPNIKAGAGAGGRRYYNEQQFREILRLLAEKRKLDARKAEIGEQIKLVGARKQTTKKS